LEGVKKKGYWRLSFRSRSSKKGGGKREKGKLPKYRSKGGDDRQKGGGEKRREQPRRCAMLSSVETKGTEEKRDFSERGKPRATRGGEQKKVVC